MNKAESILYRIPKGEFHTPKSAGEMWDIDQLKITSHAMERLSIRVDKPFVETMEDIRNRIASAQRVIEQQTGLTKKQRRGPRKSFYFQDQEDPNITYVLRQDKTQQIPTLITVLRPIRSSNGKKLRY